MKSKIYFIPVLMIYVFTCSCGRKMKTADDGYYFQDFDNLAMWTYDESRLTNERARSGSYSTFTDSAHEFSQTFEMELDYANSKKYRKISVAGWCFTTSGNIKTTLVVAIEAPGKTILAGGSNLSDAMGEINQWQKVHTDLKIPLDGPPGTKIKAYLWSSHGEKVFLDDLEIQFSK